MHTYTLLTKQLFPERKRQGWERGSNSNHLLVILRFLLSVNIFPKCFSAIFFQCHFGFLLVIWAAYSNRLNDIIWWPITAGVLKRSLTMDVSSTYPGDPEVMWWENLLGVWIKKYGYWTVMSSYRSRHMGNFPMRRFFKRQLSLTRMKSAIWLQCFQAKEAWGVITGHSHVLHSVQKVGFVSQSLGTTKRSE